MGYRLAFKTASYVSGSLIGFWLLTGLTLDPFAKFVLGLMTLTCMFRSAVAGRLLLKWTRYPVVFETKEMVVFPKSTIHLPRLSDDCLLWIKVSGSVGLVDGQ